VGPSLAFDLAAESAQLRTDELPSGYLLTLEPNVAHDVEALDEIVFRLTVARPSGRDAG
jgi:hypothetical protein